MDELKFDKEDLQNSLYVSELYKEFVPVKYDSNGQCLVNYQNGEAVITLPLDVSARPDIIAGYLQICNDNQSLYINLRFEKYKEPPVMIVVNDVNDFITKNKFTINAHDKKNKAELICGVADNIEEAMLCASMIARNISSSVDKVFIKNTDSQRTVGTVLKENKSHERI